MASEIKSGKGKNKETVLLIIVALFGVAGLLALQFSRKTAVNRAEDRAVVQVENAENTNNPEASAPIQRIPGELLRTSEYPEAGKPFRFFMSKYSQGPEYELDFGDGSPRKKFVDGAVQHVFKNHGPCVVTLYARYEGQEVALDTLQKIVARRKVDSPVAPIIDY